MSKNPITGDVIMSKIGDTDKYNEGWERIFGSLPKVPECPDQKKAYEEDDEEKIPPV